MITTCVCKIQCHLNKYREAPSEVPLFSPVMKEEINYFTLRLIMCGCQPVFGVKHGNYVLCSSPLSPGMLRETKQRYSEVFVITALLPHLSDVISQL